MSDRFVTLGLARARAPWFHEVARWATSGSLAMDFVKAVSVDEVRVRLGSERPFSALLVDGSIAGVDRDVLEAAGAHGCAAIVVTDGGARDWVALGAAAVLPTDFTPAELETVLREHAAPIGSIDDLPGTVRTDGDADAGGFRARTVAVTGPGGTGASTIAIAIAQGAAADVRHADTTLLADLALHADQAMLHDARDVIPGVPELVEAHRAGVPTPEEVRRLTFDVVDRRYRLLLGLRRHRDWTAMRPRALRAAVDTLRRSFTLVVADIDDDLEGEEDTGSADVGDRNLLARSTIEIADVVVVVGMPGMKGIHSMLRVARECLAAGVPAESIVPVVNRAPRKRTARLELSRSVTDLLAASNPDEDILSPVFVPERRGIDEALRDGAALGSAIVDPVTTAVLTRLELADRSRTVEAEPEPIEPGSLGAWSEEAAG